MEIFLSRRRAVMVGGHQGGVLPSGYTKLDYLTGATKPLNTGIAAAGSRWLLDVQIDNLPTQAQVVICTDSAGGHFGGYIATPKKWGVADNLYFSDTVTNRLVLEAEFTTNGIKLTLNGVTKSREGVAAHPANVHLFATSANGYRYTERMYEAKCLSGGSFHGIPAQRDSDEKQGLYDIENDIFYEIK